MGAVETPLGAGVNGVGGGVAAVSGVAVAGAVARGGGGGTDVRRWLPVVVDVRPRIDAIFELRAPRLWFWPVQIPGQRKFVPRWRVRRGRARCPRCVWGCVVCLLVLFWVLGLWSRERVPVERRR